MSKKSRPIIKDPGTLRKAELVDCVDRIQRVMYIAEDEEGHAIWSLDAEWDSDTIDDVATVLQTFRLTPWRNGRVIQDKKSSTRTTRSVRSASSKASS